MFPTVAGSLISRLAGFCQDAWSYEKVVGLNKFQWHRAGSSKTISILQYSNNYFEPLQPWKVHWKSILSNSTVVPQVVKLLSSLTCFWPAWKSLHCWHLFNTKNENLKYQERYIIQATDNFWWTGWVLISCFYVSTTWITAYDSVFCNLLRMRCSCKDTFNTSLPLLSSCCCEFASPILCLDRVLLLSSPSPMSFQLRCRRALALLLAAQSVHFAFVGSWRALHEPRAPTATLRKGAREVNRTFWGGVFFGWCVGFCEI